VSQHLEYGRSLAELTAENGINLRRAYLLFPCYGSAGPSSLANRRSVRRILRGTLDPQHSQPAIDPRHKRLHLWHIARM
jgi:hypothetical protein